MSVKIKEYRKNWNFSDIVKVDSGEYYYISLASTFEFDGYEVAVFPVSPDDFSVTDWMSVIRKQFYEKEDAVEFYIKLVKNLEAYL